MENNITFGFSHIDPNEVTFNEEQNVFTMDHDVSTTSTAYINQGQQSDNRSDHAIDEKDEFSLENTLKEYELKIGFKSIKYRVEHNNSEKESKKVGCPWQLNAGYRKNLNVIVINKPECCLGAKAQRRYISKKFSDQPLYDCDLYNAIHRYTKQM
ncbi:25830_t:CDS:2, partial [Gigaspora rosea]